MTEFAALVLLCVIALPLLYEAFLIADHQKGKK